MSYLSNPTSNIEYGVVKVGNYINVTDGIISLLQDVGPNSSVSFANVSVSGDLRSNGNLVVTSVTPGANDGIALTNVVSGGTAASFNIRNTGVLSVTAGPGITVSNTTGNITLSADPAHALISTVGANTSYTVTANDEYVGIYSTAAVTVTLPVGQNGRIYYIKDEYGQGSGKINITSAVGEKIDGANTYVISVPYQCITIVFRASQWRLI